MDRRSVVQVRLPHHAHAEPLHVASRIGEVGGLEDRHVAGVAAAPVDPAAGCGIGLHRRDELEEGVAEWQHSILEAEHPHSAVVERFAEAQYAPELAERRLEVSHR